MENGFYQCHVFCCTNRRADGHKTGCCASKNAEVLRHFMKKRAAELNIPNTRINTAGCLDRCALGPVMVIYPEGAWYHYKTEADIEEILQSHVIGKTIVTRLLLADDQKVLP